MYWKLFGNKKKREEWIIIESWKATHFISKHWKSVDKLDAETKNRNAKFNNKEKYFRNEAGNPNRQWKKKS